MTCKVDLKGKVRDFWGESSCGEVYATGGSAKAYYESHRKTRYRLESYIFEFAKFQEGQDKDVLEIGVGMGADHIEWAKSNPRRLVGIDLTSRAIEHTTRRLNLYGLKSDIIVADAEELPFDDNSLDIVYSWGVLHHSADTQKAIDEVLRVLRPSGTARIMIYHKYSLTGFMLWARYGWNGWISGRSFHSLNDVYANHLESPGTKAYSVKEADRMFQGFSKVVFDIRLSCGDLLEGIAGQRHKGWVLFIAKCLWPRHLIRAFLKSCGLFLLIEATK